MSKKFQKFDFGEAGNMQHYKQKTPPQYKMANWTVPTAIYASKNDWLADPTDVKLLEPFLGKALKSSVDIYNYNHLDFVWATDAYIQVYSRVMDFFSKY